MVGINKNKIRLSRLGYGAIEIDELFDGLNREDQTYLTNIVARFTIMGLDTYKTMTQAFAIKGELL